MKIRTINNNRINHIHSMNQEYGSSYPNIPATTIPYWDDRCGIKTSDINLIPGLVKEMLGNLDKYQPREFVKDTLSSEACWKGINWRCRCGFP
jgi:hypothetical protein